MNRLARERLKWKARRGLLELDLVFERFIPTLKDEDLPGFSALLELPDNQLWDVIAGRSDEYDARFNPLVARLRAL
jgi:succinate dehydrogenase flavin-adding protein (antitoxin of CptAB toxin-antitoxin module)